MNKRERALRKWAKKHREGLKQTAPVIYEYCCAHLSDEELLQMALEVQAKWASLAPGEAFEFAIQWPDGKVEPLKGIIKQNEAGN
jgi:hypothetical protein